MDPVDPAGPGGCGDDPVQALRDRAADLLFACYAACGPDRFVLVGGLPSQAGIVACTGAVEIAVHGWDVCVARGRGGPIPARLAIPMLRLSPLLVAGREGLFAEPVETSPQASPVTSSSPTSASAPPVVTPDTPARGTTPASPTVVTGE